MIDDINTKVIEGGSDTIGTDFFVRSSDSSDFVLPQAYTSENESSKFFHPKSMVKYDSV